MKLWQEADFSTAKKWDPFTYMKIQCQTWLAPEAALKKLEEREKKEGGKGEYELERWASAQQGSRGQTMQSRLCPAARFSSYRLQCSPEWLQSKVSSSTKNQNQRAASGNPIGKEATWLCRDAMRQVWQQQPQRILQPQPCRSSKTIAGLMQTRLTSEPCTDGLPASRRLRAWGKQRAKGNAFVTKTQEGDQEARM